MTRHGLNPRPSGRGARQKNIGVDKLEPFEVRDSRPSGDPVREGA